MSFKLNPTTRKFDYYLGKEVSSYASAPSSPKSGQMYINTTDHKVYIYYSSQWQVLHTLSAVAPTIVAGNPIGLLLSLTYSGTP